MNDSFCRDAAKDKDYLKTIGVTHVLNVADGNVMFGVDTDEKFYEDVGIKYLGVNLSDVDDCPIFHCFHPSAEFIDDGLSSGGMYLRFIGKFLALSDG